MKINEITDQTFLGFLPKRNENTSKFDYGRAVILGGSIDYGGAPLLSYEALLALRLGAGFSTLYVPEPLYSIYVGRNPQVIVQKAPSKDGNIIYEESFFRRIEQKATAIALGMGMTGKEALLPILHDFFDHYEGKLLLDAGALDALSIDEAFASRTSLKPQTLITPHHGEFARLLGIPREQIDQKPLFYAASYAKRHHLVVLLKGHETWITDGENALLNRFGNAGQAKAGSGDLLSGILCGILSMPLPHTLIEEAAFGAYLFGKAATLLAKEQNEYSFLAEDILRIMPKAMGPCVANK